MSIFTGSSSDDGSSRSGPVQSGSPENDQINFIGDGTVFEGTIRTNGPVRVSGQVNGTLDVEGGKAVISESGAVEGEILATAAEVAGRVQGEIDIGEYLRLRDTADVEGRIQTGRLVVEDGAQLNGECEMERPVSPSAEPDEAHDNETGGE